MKRTAVLMIILLAMASSTCFAEAWYVAAEASGYEFVNPAATIFLANDEPDPGFAPPYDYKDYYKINKESSEYARIENLPREANLGTIYPDEAIGAEALSPPSPPSDLTSLE